MKQIVMLMALVVASFPVSAQNVHSPQSARQALLDMFFGQPGSFEKHLPNATRTALRTAAGNGPSILDQISLFTALAKAPGSHVQTFDTGSTLLAFNDDRTQSKFEVNIEKDDLRADEDEIEVSFQAYKDGQPQSTAVSPRLTFLMKQEARIWKLNEISLTVRVPLADPEFLKTVVNTIQQQQALRTATENSAAMHPSAGAAMYQQPNDAAALASFRNILNAEVTYASTYPAHGYTCVLSDLDGFGADTPDEHHAMLIPTRLASGKKDGYVFSLTGCSSTPARHFQLVATPAAPGMRARTFCADQSGLVRESLDGHGATCLSSGKPLN
ncbi:MAG TPA: hypothetical protein VFI95_00705 [Terriglobales bacterium]|nr:hypothetical protein [Terriglobales bacterium]